MSKSLVFALLLCLLCTGCGDSKWLRSVGSYTVTAPTLDQVSLAYTQANDIHTMQERI